MVAPPLVPQRPPGRSTRKARAFSAEIQRLQEAGYTLDAIREALAGAGVVVSKSTVHREAMRKYAMRPSLALMTPPSPATRADTPTTGASTEGGADALVSTPAHAQRGRDVAADFVSKRNTNPLLRKDRP